jgi:hypothetical protein
VDNKISIAALLFATTPFLTPLLANDKIYYSPKVNQKVEVWRMIVIFNPKKP